MASMGTTSRDELIGPLSLMVDVTDDETIHVTAALELLCPMDKLADGISHASSEDVIHIVVACDDTNIP